MNAQAKTRFTCREIANDLFSLHDRQPPLPQAGTCYFNEGVARRVDDLLHWTGKESGRTRRAEMSFQKVAAVTALRTAVDCALDANSAFGCPAQAILNLQAMTQEVIAHVVAMALASEEEGNISSISDALKRGEP